MILCNTKRFEQLVKIRERIFYFLTVQLYFPFCKAVYAGKGEALSLETLTNMPSDSLGHQTALFLQQNAFEPMPGYEAHDMKHTLLGYSPNMPGEICMQYFEFGNGNRSLPVFTVMFFGTFLLPEKYFEFRRHYFRGKAAVKLSSVNLKHYAKEPLKKLQTLWKIS